MSGTSNPRWSFDYWGGTGRTWGLVIREMAGRRRCVAPDLRGWGGRTRKADGYDLHTQADDVAAIIASLGLSQYILVGQSMGGSRPDTRRTPTEGLKGLVLVAPAPPTPIAAPKEQRDAMLESYQTPAGVEFALSILTSRQLSPELRQQVIDDTLSGSQAAKAAWTQAGMTLDISDIVGNINVPTTIIVGDADKVETEPLLRREFAPRISGAEFIVLPGVGHLSSLKPRASWQPPSQRRYRNLLRPTIAASQEKDEPWASLIRNTRRQSCRRRLLIDLEGTVAKTIRYIEEAAKEGAKLIAFPETWIRVIPGTSGWERRRGRWEGVRTALLRQFPKLRQPARSENRRRGAGQQDHRGARSFGARWRQSLHLPMADWSRRGNHRQTSQASAHPCRRTVFGEGDGSHIAVHDRADLGRLGALCCSEHLQPLTKYAMYAQNEQVHVGAWPSFSMNEPFAHALGWETNNAVSKVYAVEGSCFVLAPCAVISREMVEEMCDTEDKRSLVHEGGGHAVIYGPDGSPLAEKLPETSEGIVYATIDLAAIGVAKNAADPAGHYFPPRRRSAVVQQQAGEEGGALLASARCSCA